jgi:gliding motility-associated-like protein
LKEQKNIEEIFKESFKEFEVDPGSNAWANIQSQISTPIVTSTSNTGIVSASGSKILTAIIGFGIISLAVGGYYYFNNKGEQKVEQAQNSVSEPKMEIENSEEKILEEKETMETNEVSSEETSPIEKSIDVNNIDQAKKIQIEKQAEKNTSYSDKNAESNPEIIQEPRDSQLNSSIIEEEVISDKASLIEPIQTNTSNTEDQVSKVEEIISESPATVIETGATKDSEKIDEGNKIIIANIFTPNNDNVHDNFNVDIEGYETIKVQIISKTGKLLHQWAGEYGFWDGNNPNGTPAPNDTYFYSIEFKKDDKSIQKTGTITLRR